MYVNAEAKIIFVHNPKAAGSAIHSLLKDVYDVPQGLRQDPEPEIHHQSYQQILDLNEEYKEYFSFAVVRNPWARLLSGYLDFVQNRKHQYSGKIKLDKPLLSEYDNFKDFVMKFDEGPWNKDVHFLPQHVYTHAEGRTVDLIMRQENLTVDVHGLMTKLGFRYYQQWFSPDPIHRTTRHGHYSEYYDEESAAKVADLIAKDIELFGYKFEIPEEPKR